MVNGVCPAPCKGEDDPLCKDTSEIPPILTEPGGPIVVDPTPPLLLAEGAAGSLVKRAACPKQALG